MEFKTHLRHTLENPNNSAEKKYKWIIKQFFKMIVNCRSHVLSLKPVITIIFTR